MLSRNQQSSPPPPSNALTFDEPLSWKAGRPIAIHTLVKRLKTLSEELQKLEQEDVDRKSLAKAAKELCNPALLQHKDKGVKAFTACCLTDMLRLHAPDAPYTALQLRDIFELFIKQLRNLTDLESPYYDQYYHLLTSLAQVQSMVLISDIPNGEPLILQLFTNLFDVGAKPEITKTVEYNMTDILRQVIDEVHHLPSEVVDIIVAQFLRAPTASLTNIGGKKSTGKKDDDKQTTLTQHILPVPAYTMAKDLCTNASSVDKMSRHICQYFSEVILDATPNSRPHRKGSLSPEGSPEPDAQHEPTEEDLIELSKAHKLVKELWRAAPAVLQNVIPQLEQELITENVQLRLLAVETIGDMAASNLGSFSSAAPGTWKVWCGRLMDKSYQVRVKWVESAVRVLQARSDSMGLALIPLISDKLNDTDERVRLAVCRAIGEELGYRSITAKLTPEHGGDKLLENLALRAKDKKHAVRQEGMKVLAKIWDMAYDDIQRGLDGVIKQLGWIPGSVLETSYVNDKDINVLMDHVIWEILLPLDYPPGSLESKAANGKDAANGKNASKSARLKEKERSKDKGKGKEDAGSDSQTENSQQMSTLDYDRLRTVRILHLAHNLSPRSLKAFLALAARQLSYSAVLNQFVASASEYNSGTTNTITESTPSSGATQAELKTRLTKVINWLSTHFPDPEKSREHLWKWVKIGDRRSWNLAKTMMSVDENWATVVKSLKEIVKRIETAPGNGSIILETIVPLLYRSALLLYNKSHVPTIVEYSKTAAEKNQEQDPVEAEFNTGENELGTTANLILKEMSSSLPAVFKAHIASLTTIVQEMAPPIPGSRKAVTAVSTPPVDISIVDTLSALSTFSLRYPQDVPRDRKLHQALFALATSPLSSPKAAKHAVRVLMSAALDRREMYATDLIEKCVKEWEWGVEGFVIQLGALAELVMQAPRDLIDDVSEKIVKICLEQCLLKVRGGVAENQDEQEKSQWVDDEDLSPEGYAKILALKTMVNNLRKRTNYHNARDLAKPVFSILDLLIQKKGELSPMRDTPEPHRARLRLAAGQHLLGLATYPIFEEMITPTRFIGLALLAQDNKGYVREGFIKRLKKYLASGLLPARYYVIILLMAYEPRDDFRNETVTWMKARAKALASTSANTKPPSTPTKSPTNTPARNANVLELIFSHLLSLLAHHPDFKTESGDLLDFAKYIIFYVRMVVTRENIGLVFHVAQKVKQVKDGINPAKSENLYYLSDLAQLILRKYEELNNWGGVPTWPGSIGLPKALFESMQNSKERLDNAKKVYLPDGVEDKLDTLIKPQRKHASTANAATHTGAISTKDNANGTKTATYHASASKKRKSMDNPSSSTNTPKQPPKKRRQRRSAEDEVGIESDSSDGDEHDKPSKTPKKRRKSSGATKTPKRKKQEGEMSTVERRRSGRAVQRVTYAEDDDDDSLTGEELEGSDEDVGSDNQSESEGEGEGSGDEVDEDEDEDEDEEKAGDRMDVDEEEDVGTRSKGKGKLSVSKTSPSSRKRAVPKALARKGRRATRSTANNEDEEMNDDDLELSSPPSPLSKQSPEVTEANGKDVSYKNTPTAADKSADLTDEGEPAESPEKTEKAGVEKSFGIVRQSRRTSSRGVAANKATIATPPSVTKTLAIAKGKPPKAKASAGRKKPEPEDAEDEAAEAETQVRDDGETSTPVEEKSKGNRKEKEPLKSPPAVGRSTRGSARLAK